MLKNQKKQSLSDGLWEKYHSAKTERIKKNALKSLVEYYYPLVEKISYTVAKHLNWNVGTDELSSFGVDGLYIAIQKFNPNRKVKFESYASFRIHGSMIDIIRKQDKIPRTVRCNNNKFEKIRQYLESIKNDKVSDYEVIKEMGISESEYFKNFHKYHPLICIYHQAYFQKIAEIMIAEKKVKVEHTKCLFRGDSYEEFKIIWG